MNQTTPASRPNGILPILPSAMQPGSSIALIFFSRSAAAEAQSKHWLGRERTRQNHALARLLIAQSRAHIAASRLQIIDYDERLQRGKTFGERLANAFADVFAQGYRAAIAVGNDSPEIAKTDWEALQLALAQGHSVLGPTMRGGAYLIGLQSESFDHDAFAQLPWQSAETYAALQVHLRATHDLPVRELGRMRDLNSAHDLRSFLRGHQDAFARALQALLGVQVLFAEVANARPSTPLRTRRPLRGPPALI